MYGIKERTPGAYRIEAWVRQSGSLLLYEYKKDAQNKVDVLNELDGNRNRYFLAEFIL